MSKVDGDLARLIPCVLETLWTLESKGEVPELSRIKREASRQLNCSLAELEEALKVGVMEGLIERREDSVRLTSKGRAEVLRHRERYFHDRYVHRLTPLGRAAKVLEGSIKDWGLHWRRRHGLTTDSLRGSTRASRDFKGELKTPFHFPG